MKPGCRGWRASGIEAGSPSKVLSLWSSEVEGLTLRSRAEENLFSSGEEGGEEARAELLFPFEVPVLGAASLKTCTVSVAEETHRSVEVALKLMQ
jgi:hypothetical protein